MAVPPRYDVAMNPYSYGLGGSETYLNRYKRN